MSNSTANWFLPTGTWKRHTVDYALVSQRAAPIQRELRMHDRLPNVHYYNYLHYADNWHTNHYRFAPCGHTQLIYADVDQANPAHKDLVKRWAEQPEASVEEPSVLSAKEKLFDAARAKFGFESSPEADSHAAGQASSSRPPPPSSDAAYTWTDSAILSELRHHFSDEHSWIIRYILRLPSRSAKSTVLRILSEQSRTAIVRPTMLLLHVLDSGQSSTEGQTLGWATAYDFLDNVIIIKPFVSKENHHPLGERWSDPVVNDGVAFRGSPQELLTLVTADEDPLSGNSQNFYFARIVREEAAGWVLEYERALGVDSHLCEGVEMLQAQRQDEAGREELAGVEFPNLVKGKGKGADGKDAWRAEVRWLYETMMAGLEGAEVEFRGAAVGAREAGREAVARNLVGFYERTMKDLEGLVKDPARKG